MPTPTYTPLATTTVGSGGASTIDFQNISSSYTDLYIQLSVFISSNDSVYISFNNNSSNYSGFFLEGNGSTVSAGAMGDGRYIAFPITTTANAFASVGVYVPNYAGSATKTFSTDSSMPANVSTAYLDLNTNIWSNTASINRVTFSISTGGRVFQQYSTVTIFGIKNT